tara:strand:+ start:188 stop:1519 length:1332 start_codon:yes stop_codon:yes gene_type:complete
MAESNILANLFEGLKQGYMDTGGATPGNVFRGPTPRAGNAPEGFVGGLGDFLGGLGGRVTDLALHTLPDVIKDPTSFVNDKGELSITRVLFPDFRREKQKEAKADAERQRAMDAARVITQGTDFVKTLIDQTPEQRYATVQQFEAAGGTPEQSNAALGQANVYDQKKDAIAREAQAMGMSPLMTQDMSSDELRALAIQQAHDKATLGRQTISDMYRAKAEGRAVADQAAQDLRPPELKKYESDMDKYNTTSTAYAKDLYAEEKKAETAAEKAWVTQKTNEAAATGNLEVPPFPEEARKAARAAGRTAYTQAVPPPVAPQSPFTAKNAGKQVDEAYPATTRKNLGARIAIHKDAKALAKTGADKVTATYIAAFMHAIEHPEATKRIIAPHKGETPEAIVAKIKAGIAVFKPGNATMVMEILHDAGYDPAALAAAGDIIDAEQAK